MHRQDEQISPWDIQNNLSKKSQTKTCLIRRKRQSLKKSKLSQRQCLLDQQIVKNNKSILQLIKSIRVTRQNWHQKRNTIAMRNKFSFINSNQIVHPKKNPRILKQQIKLTRLSCIDYFKVQKRKSY